MRGRTLKELVDEYESAGGFLPSRHLEGRKVISVDPMIEPFEGTISLLGGSIFSMQEGDVHHLENYILMDEDPGCGAPEND